MRSLRTALSLTLTAVLATPAAAELPVSAHPSLVEKEQTQTCSVINKRELERAGQRPSAQDIINSVPAPAAENTETCPPQEQQAPPPQYQIPPPGTIRPIGAEGGADGPQFGPPPTQTPPDLVKDITPGPLVDIGEHEGTDEPPETPTVPFVEVVDQARAAFHDLHDALKRCDAKAVAKLRPHIEDLLKKAHLALQWELHFQALHRDSAELTRSGEWGATLARELEDELALAAAEAETPNRCDRPEIQLAESLRTYSMNQRGAAPVDPPVLNPEESDLKPPEHSIIDDIKHTPTIASRHDSTPTGEGAFAAIPIKPAEQTNLSAFASELLTIQNAQRAAVGAQPLRWNAELAEHATAYAQQLAQLGQLAHAPRDGRGIERENLAQARVGWSPSEIVDREWTSEKRFFHSGIFPNVCQGDWSQCAHFTQMIWPTTTDVGCGYAVGHGYGWLVCRYSPGGNKDGKAVGYLSATNLRQPPPVAPPPPAPPPEP